MRSASPTTAIPNLQAASTKAQQYVNAGNQGVLQPLIDDLNGQISAASNATNGLAATVLAYTPQQWNANNNLLAPSKQSDAQADAAVAKGRQDVKQIRAIVRNHVQGSPNSPSAAGEHADHHLIPHRSHRLPEATSLSRHRIPHPRCRAGGV